MSALSILAVVSLSNLVRASESCDGYFHKADCLASETKCGWKGCMYASTQCPVGMPSCNTADKVVVFDGIPGWEQICVPLLKTGPALWECDDDPPGYLCPSTFSLPQSSDVLDTSRRCVIGVTRNKAHSDEDGDVWLIGFSGGLSAFVLMIVGATACAAVVAAFCYYSCQGQCEKLPDEADEEYSDGIDHDRGGGLDAEWSDSDGEDGSGIQLEAMPNRPSPGLSVARAPSTTARSSSESDIS